jgi:hypothetical protein
MEVLPNTGWPSTPVRTTLGRTCEIDAIMRSFPAFAAILGLTAALQTPCSAAQAPRAAAETTANALPDPGNAVSTFFAARAWLDRGGAGQAVVAPADVRSAAVVLRLQGRLVGFGKDDGASPVAATVDRALRMALDDARTRRTELSKGAGNASLGALVTLELELAGAREPLIGRTFEEVARSIEPGECGLQLVDANRTSYEPSSFLLARRMASPVSRAVLAMVTDLRLPPRDLPELQALGGSTAIYAARCIRLAQSAPDAMPTALARVVPAAANEPATRADVALLCGEIVARLADELKPPSAAEGLPPDAVEQMARTGLRGDYLIAADRWEPFVAGPIEQALTAWAFARAAATRSWPMPLRIQAAETAARILVALADRDPSERDPASEPAAVAYALLADAELASPDAPTHAAAPAPFARAMSETLAKLLPRASLATMRPHVRAAVLDAAAAAAPMPIPMPELVAALDAAWGETETAELPLVAPFLLDAERRIGGTAWEQRLAARRASLEAARTVLVATQVRAGAPDRAPSLLDMPGAYPMVGSASGRISAQSTRAQVFVAMLAGLTTTRSAARDDEDRATLGWATRFVRQLTATAAIDYCAPTPGRARGGVLASPADAAQPLAAQAVAVLALTETERALARLETAPGKP